MSSGGKGGSSSAASKTYNYYGSIAMRVRCGRTDTLHAIELDGQTLWSGPVLRADSPNPFVGTIVGRGTFRYYWGLSNQFTVDPVLTAAGNDKGHDHPAYTGQSYLVFENFLFGQERNFANRIKVIASAIPEQTLITGTAAALDADGQANPYAALAELATNERFGQGLPSGTFASSTWQSSADAALAKSSLTYISALMTQQKSLKQVSEDILVLCDGWLRAAQATGACEAGYFPQPETIDPSTLPLIDSSSIAAGENPSWDPETWRDVKTSWVCIYTDKDKDYKSRPSQRYDDPRALAARSLRDPDTLERPFICRSGQAFEHAQRYGRRFSVPGAKGEIPVRRVVAESLRPGQHLRLDIDPEPGGAQLQQVCRLISITRPQTGSVKLRVEIEPTLQPIAFTAPSPATEPPPPDAIPDVGYARFVEAPMGLVDGRSYAVAILASRPGGLVIDFTAYYDRDLSGAFPQIGGSRAYGLRGKLNATTALTAIGPFVVDLLDPLNRELIGEDPGDAAARDDSLLMIVLKITGGQIAPDGENKAWVEIFSCESFVVSGTNQVSVTALRARKGTPARDFAANDEVWFIRREALTIVEHADFPGLAGTGDYAYFKLQPGTLTDQRPLEDCALRQFTFALNRDGTSTGGTGTYLETRYKRSNLVPTTPTGNTPAGWSLTRPTGSGAIWASRANKDATTGDVIGVWSTPIRIEGSVYFYQGTVPDGSTVALQVDDVWFDDAHENKIYTYDGSGWVARFTPMLKLDGGNRVYGLQKADGTDTSFVLVADNFQVWNGSSAEVPFEIVGGNVYIKSGFIRELAAGKITAGTVEVALEFWAAYIKAGKIATGASRVNEENPAKLMPFSAYGRADLVSEHGGPIAPGDTSTGGTAFSSSAVSFVGWNSGSDGMTIQRFGLGTTCFLASLQGNGNVPSGRMGFDIAYRVNGGSWNTFTGHNVVADTTFGNIAMTAPAIISSLSGTDSVDFAAIIDHSSGATGPGIGQLVLSVVAFNG